MKIVFSYRRFPLEDLEFSGVQCVSEYVQRIHDSLLYCCVIYHGCSFLGCDTTYFGRWAPRCVLLQCMREDGSTWFLWYLPKLYNVTC